MTAPPGIRARFRLERAGFALDVDLDLPGRGVTALFGPSGSGKTTLLRCIAGLQRAPRGRLSVNGSLWQDDEVFVPTYRRPLGYVFQEASLFAHLSVRANLAYGLSRVAGSSRSRHDEAAAIEMLGIGPILDRATPSLSGGERQRVAIARALAVSPRLLLMDEPLASLDLARKREILPYLERLHDELDIPVLYVSHSPDEVARLADHVVLLANGRVLAQGGLQHMLARLDLHSEFDEAGVVVEARVGAHDAADHLTRLDFQGGSLLVSRCAEAVGQRVRLRVRAGDVSLAERRPEGSSILNAMPMRVVEVADAAVPGQILVKLDLGGTPFVARISGRSRRQLGVEPGRRLWAQVKSAALLR